MKKHLLLFGALALFVNLTSCKKEGSPATNSKVSEKETKLKVNTLPAPTYVDLALIARKPGENFDTYYASFHGSGVYVIAPFSYDAAKYPGLVNGVPCFGQSMYADNGASIDYQNTGIDGNVFQVTQTLFSYTDYSSIHSDMDKYFKAADAFRKSGATGTGPNIFDYVKNNYTSTNGSVIISVGKLIRVTTGSHWALAEINYPLPGQTPYTIPSTFINVPDPNNASIHYFLQGDKGLITSGNIEYLSNGSYTNGPAISVSGRYFPVTAGSSNYHSIGTVIRTDYSTLAFDQTDNTN
ncbi:hypothetical protein [Mucilaginibacter ginsenosidivorax]|uniref:Uncharacterized protein n=1 Tax=Mucilaginibacter ginsenosidivorax TaxID=862126 RepID=A0A5B8VZ75_9SPHI|nr:hypothetical protein [Mucilaginibacter ginsenosidivorax]QEC76784.1 hypothetical protein FSB76_12820 [Mucilaginibacter ginsenosidivorax]